jgi:triosephosphate isomerase
MIAKKVGAAIRNRITPILCIGETESERAFGETADVIRDQLLGGLSEVGDDDLSKVIVAYEPVWAISSTKSSKIASPDEIADVVKLIRKTLADTYGIKATEGVPVLFGGSVNPSNAGAYLTVPGVNGLLVGGASLILNQFIDIIEVAKRVRL